MGKENIFFGTPLEPCLDPGNKSGGVAKECVEASGKNGIILHPSQTQLHEFSDAESGVNNGANTRRGTGLIVCG